MCNDRELSCIEESTSKHAFCALPNLPLSSPDTDSEDQLEYHKNTIFNNFNHLLTKTKIFEYYRTRIYINFTINRINKL